MAEADDTVPAPRDKDAERRAKRAERASRARPAKSQTGSPKDRQGLSAFVRECWAELKRVQWPTRPQLIQATAVVIITCFIVGVYLYALDSLFSRLAGWLINQQAG
ncbi:MAG: preprotein translocase subunit SecE [Thermoleophilia bacterium]|jgi:preprotein translocase subunit SecE